MDNRRAMLAKVHLAKKDLGLDDVVYREVMKRATGCASAAKCSEQQLHSALAEFRRLGWVASGQRPRSRSPQARKIWALWYELHERGAVRNKGADALAAFLVRQVGVASPDWLDPEDASRVIEALRAWLRRVVEGGHG